ncbi:venom carboxylesterase-6-like [Schistocerca serialis cubense]|uniref:venom carboxylesterase-6-like n=1 Tax=Schistocerca serialis cubense TaxID=2023355 RepID=UPI00214E82FC|nr:venom carboxylesterase-6-like [Schistocerca serialis cubense]
MRACWRTWCVALACCLWLLGPAPAPARGADQHGEGEAGAEAEDAAPVVEIADGKVRGRVMTSRSGRRFYAYLGIPYAEPPVGPLRFGLPIPPEKWDDVLNATKEGSPCPQLTYPELKYRGKEDCLYLNIFTHQISETPTLEEMELRKDVIVVIHGGRFTTGSGKMADLSPENFMDHDVVLVTFNYRLGPLGFLAAGHAALPGNYGLKDQHRLLTWVRRNAMYFDGNEGSITLLGHEAGAASAHFHAISEYSKHRFSAVVSLSGTALSPWAHVSTAEARRRAFRLGELVGCPPEQLQDAPSLRACLSTKSAKALVRHAANVTDRGTPFAPTLEPFMPRNRTLRFNTTEKMIEFSVVIKEQRSWIIGTNSRDGLAQASKVLESPELMQKLNDDPETELPKYLGIVVEGEPEMMAKIGRRAWEYYFGDEKLTKDNINLLVEMTGDFNTFHGVSRSIELHTLHTSLPMFAYHFDWNGDGDSGSQGECIQEIAKYFFPGLPEDYDFRLMLPKTVDGKKTEYTEKEQKFAERMLHIILNFAHEGDPTPEPDPVLDDFSWHDAVFANYSYLLLGETLDLESGGVHGERVAFWEEALAEARAAELRSEEEIRDEQRRLFAQEEERRAAEERAAGGHKPEEVTKDQIRKIEL